MGNWFCKRVEKRILIQGLDAAGKTSLLYRMKLGEVVTTIPTIGFNVETISMGALTLTCWDLGGRDKIRPLYRHYFVNTHGIVYVIDSADKDRLDEALDELVRFVFLEEEISDTVVMILANKQDIPGAVTTQTIQESLQKKYSFNKPSSGHTVLIRPCSVVTREGVFEAFDEFSELLQLKHAGQMRPGLLPPAREEANESGKDASSKPVGDGESLALAGMKTFMKDPLSFIKSVFVRTEA